MGQSAPIYRALARALADRLEVRPITDQRWAVSSGSVAGREYQVVRRYGRYACNCQATVDDCKHVAVVRWWLREIGTSEIAGRDRYALELSGNARPADEYERLWKDEQ